MMYGMQWYVTFTLVGFSWSLLPHKDPKLAVVIIIDQFAYDTLNRVAPYLKGGIKKLHAHGVNYTNAYHDHATPATATGHAAFNTGVLPYIHGIIGNEWVDTLTGKTIRSDEDNRPQSAVLGINNIPYSHGKSSYNMKVDGISDQMIIARQPSCYTDAYAISYKSRAAIACAGSLGKAIWFDEHTGRFTSSKAYFNTLPNWLDQFNANAKVDSLSALFWPRAYPNNPSMYNFSHSTDYRFSGRNEPMVDHSIQIKNGYSMVGKTPYGVSLLFNCAHACVKDFFKKHKKGKLILWVSVSCTDKIGHLYGPNSLEVTDMLYHVDIELHKFMTQIGNTIPHRRVLYVLSADHGACPIPELIENQGMMHTHRIMVNPLIKNINESVKNNFNIENIILGFQTPQFYFNPQVFSSLDATTAQSIIDHIKAQLEATPGINKVWTYPELLQSFSNLLPLESLYRTQLYPGRSGFFSVMPSPYTVISQYPSGTSHRSPYDYDRHVPLIIYQHEAHHEQTINERVCTTQLAPTLARLMKVPRPSASTCPALPGLTGASCLALCY